MSRRMVAVVLVVVGTLIVAGVAVMSISKRAGKNTGLRVERGRHSVLLITIDTTRADHLGPYGAENIETPTLDTLAQTGVVMEQAMAVAPITLVAHTSILTGQYPPTHGVRNNGIHHVSDEVTTVAEILGQEGYRTAAFISAAVLERRYGLDQGFDLFDDDLSTGRERHSRMVPDRPAEATVDSVFSWLEGLEDDKPFFAWVHFYDPHASYSPPPPFRDRYRGRLYDGEIAYLDSQIGRLLDHPAFKNRADLATIVIGDHGESLGEHGEQTHAILAYDSTLHVPLILRVPGGPEGLRIREPVSQVDIVPTLLDLLKVKALETTAGRSLLPLIEGRHGEPRMLYAETLLPFYTYGWAKLRVGRLGRWKFIEAPTPELFDLRRDPRELSNVALSNPGPKHDLERDLSEMVAAMGDREETLELDTESIAKLQALGYLGGAGPIGPAEGGRPDPKDSIGTHVHLERARRFMQDRLFKQAEKSLDKVLTVDPNNLAALTEKANALEGGGRLDEAAEVIDSALRQSPQSPSLLAQMARIEKSRGQTQRVHELLDSALAIDPNFLPAVMQKARLLAAPGVRGEAAAFLQTALDALPGEPRLEMEMARLVDMPQGNLEIAEERLRRVLERDPFLVGAYRLLGEVLEATGREEEALESYRRGLSREPDDPDLHARCGQLLARQGQLPPAEAHLRESIRLSNGFRSEVVVALGGVLAESGRLDEARREYDRVLEKEPANPDARNNRAIALYRSGRRAEAQAELLEVVRRFPRHADAHNNLAVVYIDAVDWSGAEAMARKAVAIDPGMAPAWNNLGIALDEQGRLDEAEAGFTRCIEVQPSYWQARLNLGITLKKMGRLDKAAEVLELALEEGASRPEIHLELGDIYAQDPTTIDKAKKHYNAFLRLARRHPQAAEVAQKVADLGA